MKNKVAVYKSGSKFWFIFWLIICLPIGILYWLFKMKKTKVYNVKPN